MTRTIFEPEHEAFRELARSFFEKECAPHTARWERQGHVDRTVWHKAAELGLLGWEAPAEYGGTGVRDYRYNAIMTEEFIASGSTGFGFALHNDVMAPYLVDLTTDEQKARWLPKWVTGETITAIAMTEPGTGSDLKSIRTVARRDGDDFLISGAKTYITNGILADLVVVAAKTDPDAGHRGISLIAVERGRSGFERGRNLDKIGMKAHDTAELFFDEARVPTTNLIGVEGRGFHHLMGGLVQERLSCAVTSAAYLERALQLTSDYVRTRQIYGQPLGALQNTRFVLAEVKAAADVCRVYTDWAIGEHIAGRLTADHAAVAKMFVTERQWEAIDKCLQLFGGAGYMNEYEIARIWRDTRVQRILAGSSEVMRHIISRSMHLGEAQ
jgi:alkylation response protein AidB-like acyl-CoA dehydrogenase